MDEPREDEVEVDCIPVEFTPALVVMIGKPSPEGMAKFKMDFGGSYKEGGRIAGWMLEVLDILLKMTKANRKKLRQAALRQMMLDERKWRGAVDVDELMKAEPRGRA